MISCIALDDEPLALEVIKAFCDRIPFIQLEKTFTQTSKASVYLQKFPVDLLFLDIQMPDSNGIEFFKSLKKETMVIFTTAHSQYAVDAFTVSAVDYLLKPLQFLRFEQACQKANEYYAYLQERKAYTPSYLYVRSEYALVKIPLASILYLETLDDYIKIHQLGQKPTLTLMSMKKLMEKLPENEFVRIHRSYVVPLNKIQSVRAKTVSLGVIDLPIGTRYEQDFFRSYTDHTF